MQSASNLYVASAARQRNDETGELVFPFTRSGVVLDISTMSFSVGICRENTLDEVLRLDIAPQGVDGNNTTELTRPQPDRLRLALSATHRKLLSEETYTVYLYQVVAGLRDPLCVVTLTFLIQAAPYQPGLPREPALLQIDFTTAGPAEVIPVYEVMSSRAGIVPGYANEPDMLIGENGTGLEGQLMAVEDRLYFRSSTGTLWGVTLTGQDI